MKRNIVNKTSEFVMSSGASFAAALFFLVLGISAGIFTEIMMSGTEKEEIISYLDQYLLLANPNELTFVEILMHSAGNNLGLLFIMLLSGLSAVGFPVALAAIVYKGMALGFSAALLIDSMSFKGAAIILTSMVPQNLIIIPVFVIALVAALNTAFFTIKNRRFGFKKSLSKNVSPYLFLNSILALAIIAACFIESFFSPLLTRLIV